jgi:hypothetical protein
VNTHRYGVPVATLGGPPDAAAAGALDARERTRFAQVSGQCKQQAESRTHCLSIFANVVMTETDRVIRAADALVERELLAPRLTPV